MSKELHDLLTEMVKLYQERQCFLSVHAERLCALLPAAPAAPAPADLRPYNPTEAMRWAAKQIDPALTHEHIRALWCAMWSAAPAAPDPVTLTDAELFKIAQSLPQQPWGIGSRHCDAVAYARAAIAASKGEQA